MSMAAKSSDSGDKTLEANLQADGQVADLQETEEEDSSPLHSPMWSPVQRPLLGCLNMKHCLEIHVTAGNITFAFLNIYIYIQLTTRAL